VLTVADRGRSRRSVIASAEVADAQISSIIFCCHRCTQLAVWLPGQFSSPCLSAFSMDLRVESDNIWDAAVWPSLPIKGVSGS
jgi:hypothetical protein